MSGPLILILNGGTISLNFDSSILLILASAILGYLFQIFMIVALKYESAPIVSAIEACSVILSFAYDSLFEEKPMYVMSYIGGILVLAGTAGLLFVE